MAYTPDKREEAMVFCQKGYTDDQVSAKTGVSKQTIGNWKKLLFATGSLEKKPVKRKSGIPYKYKPDKIKELLNKSPKSEKSEPSKSKSSSQILFSPKKTKNKKDKKMKKIKF